MSNAAEWTWSQAHAPGMHVPGIATNQRISVLRSLAEIGLLGMLILLPVQFMVLPLNLALVDLWNALTLPLAWVYLIRFREKARLPYAAAMWLILLGSFVGTFAAPNPQGSFIGILKDVYLYVWFVTVAALLCVLGTRTLRRVLRFWLAVALLHGGLVTAQFLSPDVFQASAAIAAPFGSLDQWRPSGLFENANSTALFQAMSFVPLVLVRPSKIVGWILGMLLLLSIVATGSMAAIAGFLVGLSVAVVAISMASRNPGSTVKALVQLAGPTFLLAGSSYFVISLNPDLSATFAYTIFDRVEGSADGRFSLWDRGLAFLEDGSMLWGIGPDAYKDVDLLQKPLHNDLLAFAVERGFLGVLGLLLLAATAMAKGVRLLMMHGQYSSRAGPIVVVFLAAIVAFIVDAQFHQEFHSRSIWLILAVQEVILLETGSPAKA